MLSSFRRPSQEVQNIITHSDRLRQREVVSSSYSFEDSDGIATRIGSKKKKPRHKTAVISDEEVLESSVTDYSSRESSRGIVGLLQHILHDKFWGS